MMKIEGNLFDAGLPEIPPGEEPGSSVRLEPASGVFRPADPVPLPDTMLPAGPLPPLATEAGPPPPPVQPLAPPPEDTPGLTAPPLKEAVMSILHHQATTFLQEGLLLAQQQLQTAGSRALDLEQQALNEAGQVLLQTGERARMLLESARQLISPPASGENPSGSPPLPVATALPLDSSDPAAVHLSEWLAAWAAGELDPAGLLQNAQGLAESFQAEGETRRAQILDEARQAAEQIRQEARAAAAEIQEDALEVFQWMKDSLNTMAGQWAFQDEVLAGGQTSDDLLRQLTRQDENLRQMLEEEDRRILEFKRLHGRS